MRGFEARLRLNFALLSISEELIPLGRVFDNTETVYPGVPELGIESEQVNAQVIRVRGDPAARVEPGYSLAGAVPVPLLMMHTTGDGFVPISSMLRFGALAKEAGNGGMVSQRAIRSAVHCGFTRAEVWAALDDLIAWVENGEKPPSEDLSGPLDDAGLAFTSPLREGDPGGR